MRPAFSLLLAPLALLGCGSPPPSVQAPSATAVICPEGSAFDATKNFCVATMPVAPAPVAPLSPPKIAAKGDALEVTCAFGKGWVALLPASEYPKDDSFLMQALIGLTDDPAFWNGLPEARALLPFAAHPCSAEPTSFHAPPGDYFLLAGEADTFAKNGQYDKNGVRRKLHLPGASTQISLSRGELTHTWLCISCPWIFLDGAGTSPFVVLAHRNTRGRRGTDRHHALQVPVKNGKIRLRLVEAEHEETHLDELVVQMDGATLFPARGGERSALARADGHEVTLRRGTQIVLEYAVPGDHRDGDTVDIGIVATGYYVQE